MPHISLPMNISNDPPQAAETANNTKKKNRR